VQKSYHNYLNLAVLIIPVRLYSAPVKQTIDFSSLSGISGSGFSPGRKKIFLPRKFILNLNVAGFSS
jgi:hypothetical protein